jgi:hypothetical protein
MVSAVRVLMVITLMRMIIHVSCVMGGAYCVTVQTKHIVRNASQDTIEIYLTVEPLALLTA